MGGYGDVKMIDENGLRMDGRSPGDIREITIETGVIPVADGSCRMTWGTNEAIVAVYGPMEAHPRKIQRQDRAVLDVAYNMAPFSTTDRMRPGFNRAYPSKSYGGNNAGVRSEGRSILKSSGSPLTGCLNPRWKAWRKWRSTSGLAWP